MRYLRLVVLVALGVVAGLAGWWSAPEGQAPAKVAIQTDGAAGEPFLNDPEGPPWLGRKTLITPVPANMGDWTATGDNPVETALRFALPNGSCDCDEIIVKLLERAGGVVTVWVRMSGLKDDSVHAKEQWVEVSRETGSWQVVGANRQYTCHPWRPLGASQELCS